MRATKTWCEGFKLQTPSVSTKLINCYEERGTTKKGAGKLLELPDMLQDRDSL